MNITYTTANPQSGDESFLLKFELSDDEATACLLVDSGEDVNVDNLLDSDEYLAGILLTHAHLDHFRSLPSNVRSDVPVYTSPATASLIEHVLEEGNQNFGTDSPDLEEVWGDAAWTDTGWDTDAIVRSIEPVNEWTTLLGNIELKTIPAGHAPGAAGFILRFNDGGEMNHIVITGDFSFSSIGGYPGMPEHLPVDVDALFLNQSSVTNEQAEVTESLASIIDGVTQGKRVLTTASGLTGVHYAALLGHLAEHSDTEFSINIVGQAAKLYDDLDYDIPNVSTIPVYNSSTDVLMPGCVTITGPEVPVAGGAKKLYREIEKDAGSKLVQIRQSMDPVEGGVCETEDFLYARHPTDDDVDAFVEELNPTQIIYQHGNKQFYDGANPDRYDFAYEWLIDEKYAEHTLYSTDGGWQAPPWLTELTADVIRANNKDRGTFSDTFGVSQISDLPGVDRQPIDLAAEGVSVDALPVDYAAPEPEPEQPGDSETASSTGQDDQQAESETEVAVEIEGDCAAEPESTGDVGVDDEPSPADAPTASTGPEESSGAVKATDGGSATAVGPDSADVPGPELADRGLAAEAEILERLDRIEEAVGGDTIEATVVEADGVTFLQVDGQSLPEGASHGDTVSLMVDQ